MGLMDYARPSVTTDVVLFRIKKERNDNNRKKDIVALQVLLIKREEEPNKGDWSLPGGFVNIDEEIDRSGMRAGHVRSSSCTTDNLRTGV